MTGVGYYYHSVNTIGLSLSHGNHIKQLKLYYKMMNYLLFGLTAFAFIGVS